MSCLVCIKGVNSNTISLKGWESISVSIPIYLLPSLFWSMVPNYFRPSYVPSPQHSPQQLTWLKACGCPPIPWPSQCPLYTHRLALQVSIWPVGCTVAQWGETVREDFGSLTCGSTRANETLPVEIPSEEEQLCTARTLPCKPLTVWFILNTLRPCL